MVLMMIGALAQAGTVQVQLTADGHTSEVVLDGVAPCERMEFVRDEGARKVEVEVRVDPASDGELLVAVDLSRRLRIDAPSQLEMHPRLQVRDGKKASLTFGVDGDEAKLTVLAKGFDDLAACGRTVSTRRSSRSTRSTTSEE